ncbi:MAG: putative 4-hydroxybenzoate polyprenyltransferase [Chitinophagaceae bacterium]|nr:putative 4-hydroxybenzoate polyprenyltransferase [Chitinophagaceae bacterium]
MSAVSITPIQRIKQYLSLIKFSHTVFALPFAFIGFSLAVIYEQKTFEWHLLVKMLLCMVFARTAAMAFNRYLDRNIDALNPRTAKREIPAGVIKPQNALWFVIINCASFVITCYFINMLVFYLSFIALFVVLFYSYTKRFTALCHLVLGLGLSLAPIGAYLVVTGTFSWLPLLFSFIVLTWVSGFDIIYALQDEGFDKEHKLHSIPAALGIKGGLSVSTSLHIISGLLVIAAGYSASFNWIYWAGAAIFIGLLIYQHMLVKPTDLSKVNIAFMTTNGIGSIVFAIFTIVSLIFQS